MMAGYTLGTILEAARTFAPRAIAQMRQRAGGRFDPPFKIKFFVTYRCNLRCVHCNLWASPARGDELTTAEYETFFKRNPHFSLISFSGGEPTLREDLPDLVRMAARYASGSTIISVNLNGFLVERTVDALRQALAKLDPRARLIAAVSSDGPRPAHNHMRGHPQAFSRAERTIEALRGLEGPQFEVRRNVCVSPFNLDQMPDFLAQLSARGERHHLCFYQYGSHYDHTDQHKDLFVRFRQRLPEVLPRIQRMEGATDILGRIYLDLAGEFYAAKRPASVLPCYSMFASLIADPSGQVLPCINFSRELGNLRDCGFDLGGLLRTERADRVRKLVRTARCPGCWTPNEAYTTILCNFLNPALLSKWIRARLGRLL